MSDHTSQQNAMSFEAMQYDTVLSSYSMSSRAELENGTLENTAHLPSGADAMLRINLYLTSILQFLSTWSNDLHQKKY